MRLRGIVRKLFRAIPYVAKLEADLQMARDYAHATEISSEHLRNAVRGERMLWAVEKEGMRRDYESVLVPLRKAIDAECQANAELARMLTSNAPREVLCYRGVRLGLHRAAYPEDAYHLRLHIPAMQYTKVLSRADLRREHLARDYLFIEDFVAQAAESYRAAARESIRKEYHHAIQELHAGHR